MAFFLLGDVYFSMKLNSRSNPERGKTTMGWNCWSSKPKGVIRFLFTAESGPCLLWFPSHLWSSWDFSVPPTSHWNSYSVFLAAYPVSCFECTLLRSQTSITVITMGRMTALCPMTSFCLQLRCWLCHLQMPQARWSQIEAWGLRTSPQNKSHTMVITSSKAAICGPFLL